MSSSRKPVRTLEPMNAYDRDKRSWHIRQLYSSSSRSDKSREAKHEFDILKERHEFVRSNDIDPSSLSWEDQLALKYYDSLFKEFAIVNLKHWKTGQIGLRWRTEDEVLCGKGHLTCASMRCTFHDPESDLVERAAEDYDDPTMTDRPLVGTALEESEMNFGYVERGEKKTALVKVVLCRECGKKLRRAKERAKLDRERSAAAVVPRDEDRTTSGVERSRTRGDGSSSVDRGGREGGRERRSSSSVKLHTSSRGEDDDDVDDYAPTLPPDLERSTRRRSASPPPRTR